MSPSANMRFHNIVRIEMVKALLPAEGVDVVLANNSSNGAISTKPFSETILSYPTIIMHVDELESNVFGTDDQLDRAFATLQYDAQWLGSTSSALNFPNTTTASVPNSGYYAMIPKFLKCQKTYYPTPLATLTKMTIQLQRPNGNLVSEALDTLDISGIFASNTLPSGFGAGFFVEDYIFNNSGDLDENNGRFAKTPDFPNGVYAYFAGITTDPSWKKCLPNCSI